MSKITHNFYRVKSKRTIKGLSLFVLLLTGTQMSWGQAQVLGAFKEIDGGFEGQTNGAIAPVSVYGAVANAWTTQGGGSFPATITEDAAIARSGKKSYVYTATGGAKYNYSPLLVNNPFVTSTATKYTIQFYNKHTTGTDVVSNILQKLAYTGSGATANERFYSAGTSVSYAMNTWVKTYYTFTTSTLSVTGTNCAGVRSVGPGTGITIGGVVDDYVVYAGDLDTTLPDAPTLPVVSGLVVSWTAPGTGVDGGGYMVVRYATNPNADNDPNVNGIYAVGNTITNGTGSLVGKVVYTGTGTSFTDAVAGSVSGSDYYKIYTVDKAFNYSDEITVTAGAGATSTTWTTSWSNGTPDSTVEAVIDGTYSGAAFDAKKLTVNASKSLTVSSGNMTIQNEVINNGTLIVENNANLIQVNNTTNTGNVVVNRNSNPLYRLDYTIWSSPVLGTQTLAQFSPSTSQSPNRFYTYDTANNQYDNTNVPTTATFGKAAGYLIRMPNTDPTLNYDAGTATLAYPGVFTGVLNNGTISKSILDTGSGYNMIGNPYSSTISADAFMTANTASIESALYFWRKTNLAGGSAYAIYTPLGGVGTTASTSGVVLTPNGTIQVGQGFFVKAKAGATSVSFTNAMRETAPTSTQFLRTRKVDQLDRVWLNLTNASGVFSQALVGYTANATLGVDAYDGPYFNDSPVALTSNINGGEYTIQGRPAFDATDVVPLNFKTDVAGDYTIAMDHADGVFATGQDVVLVDNTTGTETSLKTSSYSFTAVAGTANTRFALKYQKTLGTNKAVFGENNVAVYRSKGTLYVNAGDVTIANIKVYDVQGKLVTELKNVKATSATIANLKATNQVLVVKITSQDNKIVTKKVVN